MPFYQFYRAINAMHSAVLATVNLSLCPSVWLSDTLVDCAQWPHGSTNDRDFFTIMVAPVILVFWRQMSSPHSNGTIFKLKVKYKWKLYTLWPYKLKLLLKNHTMAFGWYDCLWHWRCFKVIRLWHHISRKRYYRLLTGNRTLAFDWWHLWWPWRTFEGHVKYLSNWFFLFPWLRDSGLHLSDCSHLQLLVCRYCHESLSSIL